MACGVPVVAAAVGGLRDTVVDGQTGLLVAPFDADATASAIDRLLNDSELRTEYGRAGRERVRTRYTWQRVARDTADVYARVVATTRRQGSPATLPAAMQKTGAPALGGVYR
jgi:glycosyltransferase involved in cell wall biosynthesis